MRLGKPDSPAIGEHGEMKAEKDFLHLACQLRENLSQWCCRVLYASSLKMGLRRYFVHDFFAIK